MTTKEHEQRSDDYTVLIVDDDSDFRLLAGRVLDSIGCRVLYASGGAEGWTAFRNHQPSIHLVLLDILIPSLSGAVVYQRIRRIDRTVPIVVVSSLPADETGVPTDIDPFAFHLGRPYAVEELIATVHTIRRRYPLRYEAGSAIRPRRGG